MYQKKIHVEDKVSKFDFLRISCLFLIENDSKLARAKNMYCKKFQLPGFKNSKLSQDPHHIVHDYEPYNFSDLEKRNLSFRGLNYRYHPLNLITGIIVHLTSHFAVVC